MNPANLSAHLSPWHLFLNADAIVKTIMVFLALASISSWAVIAEKISRFRSLSRRAHVWLDLLGSGRSLVKLSTSIQQHPKDPFARIYAAVLGEWRQTHDQGLQSTHRGADGLKERINRVAGIATNIE